MMRTSILALFVLFGNGAALAVPAAAVAGGAAVNDAAAAAAATSAAAATDGAGEPAAATSTSISNETGGGDGSGDAVQRNLAMGDRFGARIFGKRADSRSYSDSSSSGDGGVDLRTTNKGGSARSILTCRRRDGTMYEAYHGTGTLDGVTLIFEADRNPLCQRRRLVCPSGPVDYQFFVESAVLRAPRGARGGGRLLLDYTEDVDDESGLTSDDEYMYVDMFHDSYEDAFASDDIGIDLQERDLASSKGGLAGQSTSTNTRANTKTNALVLSKNHPACLPPEIVCAKEGQKVKIVTGLSDTSSIGTRKKDKVVSGLSNTGSAGKGKGKGGSGWRSDSRDGVSRFNFLSNWRTKRGRGGQRNLEEANIEEGDSFDDNDHERNLAGQGFSKGKPITGQSEFTRTSNGSVVVRVDDYDLSGRWVKVLPSTHSRCEPKDVVYRCPLDRANMPYRGKRGGFLRDMTTCLSNAEVARQKKEKNQGLSVVIVDVSPEKKEEGGGKGGGYDYGGGKGGGYEYGKGKGGGYDYGGGKGGGYKYGQGKGGKGKGGFYQTYHSRWSKSTKSSKSSRRRLEKVGQRSVSWVPTAYAMKRRAKDVVVKRLPADHPACRTKAITLYRCRGDGMRNRLRRRNGRISRGLDVTFADLRCGYGRKKRSTRFEKAMRKKRRGDVSVAGLEGDSKGGEDSKGGSIVTTGLGGRPLQARRKRKKNKCGNPSVIGRCETKPGYILKYLPSKDCQAKKEKGTSGLAIDLPLVPFVEDENDTPINSSEGPDPPIDVVGAPCEGDSITNEGTVSMNDPHAFKLEVPYADDVMSDYDVLVSKICVGDNLINDYITVHIYGAADTSNDASLVCESVTKIFCNDDTPSSLTIVLKDTSQILVLDGLFSVDLELDLKSDGIKGQGEVESSRVTDTPTAEPTTAPVSSGPTSSPATAAPNAAPVSSGPTSSPVSSTPTTAPVSPDPTVSPVSSAPVTGNSPLRPEDDLATTMEDATILDNVLPNDIAPEGGDLTVVAVNNGEGTVGREITLPSGSSVTLNSDGTYAYDPAGGFESLETGQRATDTFVYTVSDGVGGKEVATVTIILHGANEAPRAEDDSTQTTQDRTVSDNVLPNDTDPESDPLVVTSVEGSDVNVGNEISLPSGATVILASNGEYTFNPEAQYESLKEEQQATDTFTYTISDGNGGTDEATVTISMAGVNDAPVAEDDDYGKVGNDAPVSDNVFGNVSDPEGDELTVTSVGGKDVGATGTTTITLPSGAIMTIDGDTGDFTLDPNGQFDTLDHSETATVTFEYIVSDGNGGTDSAIVTLTLTGNNTAPYAEDDSKTTLPTAAVSDTLTVNDSDPESDTLVVTLVEGSVEPDETTGVAVATLPSGAIVSVSSSGQYTYDPNSQFDSLDEGDEGFDTFTYTISDGNGGTDEATVTILMPGVNDPPVAEDDDYGKVGNDAPVSDNVFGNDSDPEADELTVTSVGGKDVDPTGTTTITLPSGAIMTIDGDTGDFTLDPNGQFDSLDHSETATVTVRVHHLGRQRRHRLGDRNVDPDGQQHGAVCRG